MRRQLPSAGPEKETTSIFLALLLAMFALLAATSCASSAVQSATSERGTANTTRSTEPAVPTQTDPVFAPTEIPAPTPIAIPPTPTPLPIETRTMLFSGDVLSHTPVIAQALRYGSESDLAYDYRPMFGDISTRVSAADLAICVLETPVSADNIGLDGYPTFEAPRELPDALVHAGYDGCSTASNHSMDRGTSGIHVTLNEMDRVSLGHAGMARSPDEAASPQLYDLDGVKVAHLSYSYSLNGFILPADEPWLVNLNDVPTIVAEANRAHDAGADLVALSIQWGNEYQQAPSAEQERLADQLTRSGVIDVIIGNHVHVVQPVTVMNGIPVVYGLGNSLSNQSDNCCRTGTQDGVMIQATVTGNRDHGYSVSELTFAPTWVDRSDFTIIYLVSALKDPDLDEGTRNVYQVSFDRTVQAIHSLGYELQLAD